MAVKMQSSILGKWGPHLLTLYVGFALLKVIPIGIVSTNIWFWMFWLFVLIFVLDDAWLSWVRDNSKNFVLFPEFASSAHQRISHHKLGVDPHGRIPPYETILFGGTHQVIDLRDKNISIVPGGAVEYFGKREGIRLVHSPVTPVDNVESLKGFFGGSYQLAKDVSYVGGAKSKGYFSLLNSLAGENTPGRLQAQQKYASDLEMVSKSIETISSGEKAIVDAIKKSWEGMQEGWWGKKVGVLKKRWGQ